MRRLLYIFCLTTGERSSERDVTDLSDHEIFAIKFQMLCNSDLAAILIDTAEDEDPQVTRSAIV